MVGDQHIRAEGFCRPDHFLRSVQRQIDPCHLLIGPSCLQAYIVKSQCRFLWVRFLDDIHDLFTFQFHPAEPDPLSGLPLQPCQNILPDLQFPVQIFPEDRMPHFQKQLPVSDPSFVPHAGPIRFQAFFRTFSPAAASAVLGGRSLHHRIIFSVVLYHILLNKQKTFL